MQADCVANDLEILKPRSWRVVIDGVGDEYEWPKKRRGVVVAQLWSARVGIAVGLGNDVMHRYISAA